MANPSKQKGTNAETAVVNYLKPTWKKAERRALNGSQDKGDIAGVPNVCIEVKNHKSMKLSEWVRQLEVEIENSKSTTGAVIHKKNGTTDVGKWYATMPVHIYVQLLKDAGY